MTRLFTDGAETGDVLGLNTYKSGASELITAVTTQKKTGSYSYRVFATSAYGAKASFWVPVGDLTEVYVRAYIYQPTGTHTHATIHVSRDSATDLPMSVTISNDTKLVSARVNNSIVESSLVQLSMDTWSLVECYLKLADSEGKIIVKVNGITLIDYTGDTNPGYGASFNRVAFATQLDSSTRDDGYIYWDDIAINDTTGDKDNSWCGDGHVIALKPNAAGDSNVLVPTSGSPINNYTMVDEIPPDSDTSYVESSTPDDYDLYNFEACGIDEELYNILRLWVSVAAKDTTTGSGIIAPLIKTSGSEIVSDQVELSTKYVNIVSEVFATNPITESAWTPEEVDALQAGVKVVQ